MKKYFIFILSILVLGLSLAQAEDDSAYMEKSRTRQYIGGPDESDLKVQTQLVKIQKSKNETTIEEAAEGF